MNLTKLVCKYFFFRFFVGFAGGGAGVVIATIILENMRSQWRTVGATLLCVSFALGISVSILSTRL